MSKEPNYKILKSHHIMVLIIVDVDFCFPYAS